jgi:hypothetical protein
MTELCASLIQALGLAIESLSGEFEQIFVKKSKRARQIDKGVIR